MLGIFLSVFSNAKIKFLALVRVTVQDQEQARNKIDVLNIISLPVDCCGQERKNWVIHGLSISEDKSPSLPLQFAAKGEFKLCHFRQLANNFYFFLFFILSICKLGRLSFKILHFEFLLSSACLENQCILREIPLHSKTAENCKDFMKVSAIIKIIKNVK